jgi:peptidoglycan/LPS O-acetylase OafA/YrhL
MNASTDNGYRPDLDGLRAIAVVSVIVHHFAEGLLPAGFLGVDIFFVLSGFVITGSLFRSGGTSLGGFLLNFYVRRAKRLLPALILCVLTSALAISLFDPSPGASLTTGLAALFGLSNMFMLNQAVDYFGGPAQLNAFTHTWSLGVEEQFYVLFPLLVWMLHLRGGRSQDSSSLIRVVALVTALSLVLFLALGGPANPVSFFLMPARFWEIGMGVLTWLFAARFGACIPSVRPVVSLLLLMAMGGLMFTPLEHAAAATVSVVILTVLLILAPTRVPPSKLLVHPATVYTGRISYSLYLWHWPALVVGRWTTGVDGWVIALPMAATVAFAVASYHLVEAPLRRRVWATRPSRTLMLAAGGLIAAAAIPLVLAGPLKGRLYLGRVPELVASGVQTLSDSYAIEGTPFRWAGKACVLASTQEVGKEIALDDCTLGDRDNARRRILVLGDSFSVAFVQAFDELVLNEGYAVSFLAAWGASPVPQIRSSNARAAANADYWGRVVPQAIAELRAGDHVLLINDLSSFSLEHPSAEQSEQLRLLGRGLNELLDALESRHAGLSVVFGIPLAREANCEPAAAMAQWYRLDSPCRFLSREETLRRRQSLERLLEDLQQRHGLRLIDLIDDLCPGQICSYEHPTGLMLYRDSFSHPSVEAARLVATRIREALLHGQTVR